MRKSFFLVGLLLAISIAVSPLYAQITFERWYGGNSRDYGHSVAQTPQGGYIVAGETSSYGSGTYDVYLIRTNGYGDTIWTKTYGGTSIDYGRSVIQTTDGGCAVAGSRLPDGGGYFDVYLIKTDSLGDSLWARTYGGGPHDYGTSVSQTADGGYIIAGYAEHEPYFHDVYLVKTDSLGNTSWTKTYGGIYDERGMSVSPTEDGGYIVAGSTNSFGAGSDDIYLLKTDSLGDSLWARTYGDTGYDAGESVAQTTDGGFIITGFTYSFGGGQRDVYLIKTDSLGDTTWTRTYGDTEADGGESVMQTSEGGYIVAGFTSHAIDSYDVYLIKTDANGDTSWTRTYGGTGWEWGTSVTQCLDGGYVLTGNTDSYGAGLNDVYLIKTDSLGLGIREEDDAPSTTNIKPALTCTPNPFTTKVAISLVGEPEHREGGEPEIKIFDITGRLVRDFSFSIRHASSPGRVCWDGTDDGGSILPGGVYFVRFRTDAFAQTKKVLLVR